jgi:hypothetical protein
MVFSARPMADEREDPDRTRPTHGRARSEAFRGLSESLATKLDAEAERRAKLLNAHDHAAADACRALARRARIVASRFSSWPPNAPFSDAMRADLEEYEDLATGARAYGIEQSASS